ncbi:MAG: hypothetical protein K2X64_03305 [Rhodocyclaceae bacterium]|nr:hypothetical protein [Rhodocyclaceae bacterium]
MDSDSHIYGLLGRIHVLMRRTLNRITDVEYMRVNPEYTREIIRIAASTGHEELTDLCIKLRMAMDLDPPRAAAPGTSEHPHEERRGGLFGAFGNHPKDPPEEEGDNRYIRSLR